MGPWHGNFPLLSLWGSGREVEFAMTHGTQTGALWQSRRVGWGGRWEGGSGSGGTWVHLWLILADVWQKTTKFCKAIFLKLKNKSIKIWLTTKKESPCQYSRCKRQRFDPWIRKISWSRKWQPIPVFLKIPWTEEPCVLQSSGPKSDMTDRLNTHTCQLSPISYNVLPFDKIND